MAKIILVGSQKGGVGKSTVSVMAATALSLTPWRRSVAIVDIDAQKSITSLRAYEMDDLDTKPPYPIYNYDLATFQERVGELESRHDIIFLDTAGKLDTAAGGDSEAVQVLQYVDLLLVPIVPGNFAVEATINYLSIAFAVQRLRPALEIVVFRNLHRTNSRTAAALSYEVSQLEGTPASVMNTPLRRYTDYEDASTLSSLYTRNSWTPVAVNFRQWLDELASLLGII